MTKKGRGKKAQNPAHQEHDFQRSRNQDRPASSTSTGSSFQGGSERAPESFRTDQAPRSDVPRSGDRGRGRGRGQVQVGCGERGFQSSELQQSQQNFPPLQSPSDQQKQKQWRPQQSQEQAPEASKKQATQPSQKQAPQATQKQAPQATQKQAPQATQKQAPQATQKQAQQAGTTTSAESMEGIQQTSAKLSQLSLKQQTQVPTTKTIALPKTDSSLYGQIPKRKNPNMAGTTGRRIEVIANVMQIKFGQKFQSTVIHYDVDIVPDVPKYLFKQIFEATRKKLFPKRYPAFDGKKNAYSAGYLPLKSPIVTEVSVFNEDGREKNYKVTLNDVNEIDLSWLLTVRPGLLDSEKNMTGIQALDIILRSAPCLRSTTVGRSFFTPPKGHVMSLGGGMDVWVGLFQSAILGWKPYLNIDVAHKGFPHSQNVIKLMETICGCNNTEDQADNQQQYDRGQQQGNRGQQRYQQQGPAELSPELVTNYKDDLKKFLKGLKVRIEIPGQPTSRRTQHVNDFVKCPRDDIFDHNGRNISVEQYYALEKNYKIKYPLLPCLWVGPRDKNIHVPPEICTIIAGQAVQRKLDEKQTAKMIRHAATGTNERKKKIMDAFNQMNHNQDPCMKEFDISISGEFEKVPARVLEPPQLKYQNRTTRVSKGVWQAEKFLNPSTQISQDNSWTILNLNRQTQERNLYELKENLVRAANSVGMHIGNPATPFQSIQLRGFDIRPLHQYFEEQKKKNLQLIIVIVPEMKGPYSKVKQISELKIGILTQCLKGKTLWKLSPATVGNILLKINAKLDGINHSFDMTNSRPKCLTVPCMIVGADVTHPSPESTDMPSIAAVAASHDPNAFQYNVEIRLQARRQEIIGELKQIMITQLKYFYKKTNHQPQKIIFYRDGVSEGQFIQVMQAELLAIRQACESLSQNYKPQITFLVVQKRHHIRLFPTHKNNSDDALRNFNVQAGTIVDTDITHPSDMDFYLVSHASIQGTARPTKYRCLWDDSNMNEDELEKLTYFLCHMFSRCTRSVSYPTPTYYAHLAAFRARALTQDVNIDLNNLQQEQLRKLTLKDEVLKNRPMFFV